MLHYIKRSPPYQSGDSFLFLDFTGFFCYRFYWSVALAHFAAFPKQKLHFFQAGPIQQEIIYIHRQNAILIIIGLHHVLGDHDLLK